MNELTNKQIRMACLFKAVEVLGPNRFRFTAAKEVAGPFLAAAQQFYDFVTADDEARFRAGVDIAGPRPDKTTIQVEPVLHDWTAAFHLGYPVNGQDILCGMFSTKDKRQSMWENAIILPGLLTLNEAKKYCPIGYRLPTDEEWHWLIVNTKFIFDKKSKEGVFVFKDDCKLRLAAAGWRDGHDEPYRRGKAGYYWLSDIYARGCHMRFNENGPRICGPMVCPNTSTDAISVLYLPIEVKPNQYSNHYDNNK